jgi:hypothetical protein
MNFAPALRMCSVSSGWPAWRTLRAARETDRAAASALPLPRGAASTYATGTCPVKVCATPPPLRCRRRTAPSTSDLHPLGRTSRRPERTPAGPVWGRRLTASGPVNRGACRAGPSQPRADRGSSSRCARAVFTNSASAGISPAGARIPCAEPAGLLAAAVGSHRRRALHRPLLQFLVGLHFLQWNAVRHGMMHGSVTRCW